jgi:hypothetical protein
MKKQFMTAVLAYLFVASCFLDAQTGDDALLVRVDDDTQQVRVEAFDGATGRWLAIASGYRDSADAGWLKIAGWARNLNPSGDGEFQGIPFCREVAKRRDS